MRVSQALERVLLLAARYDMSVLCLSQLPDLRDMRRRHRRERPQMIIRLGYGTRPRWPVTELMAQ
ncbi:hypothetical protein [Nonomuraea sp. NPDC003214]